MNSRRRVGLVVAVLAAAGCSSGGSGTPTPAAALATATLRPTAATTANPGPAPTPIVYYEATYTGEGGGHGGPPLLDLPSPIVVDYTVSGTCDFTIKVTFGVPDNAIEASRLTVIATGKTISGTWSPVIKPNKYYVVGSEAIGCPFHLVVRAPSAIASPHATPVVYYGATKTVLVLGGHGGAPDIDLPADLQVDYTVHGTCTFSLSLATTESTPGLPQLSIPVAGIEVTGTWRFTIPPGSYAVLEGAADGCTYDWTLHDPA